MERIQVSGQTSFDRYPTIFSAVAAFAERQPHPFRILSFGCSSGEEVFTLDSKYLHNAEIVGVDIDFEALAKARAINYTKSNSIAFFHSSDTEWKRQCFDAVLALSVLCRWPESRNMSNITDKYPYACYAGQVRELGALVRRGGLLVIHNSSYYFEDTLTCREWFKPSHLEIFDIGEVKRFDIDGNRYINSRPGVNFFQRI